MPLVYVVDDEPHIRRLVSIGLRDEGYDIQEFSDGNAFLHALGIKRPDAVVLDWMMPPPDGLSCLRQIRENPKCRALPVILLTARGDEVDRVLGLEIGADDYVTKPFSNKELAARIKSLLRRDSYLHAAPDILSCGDLTLDVGRRAVRKNGVPIELSLREFELLYELMQNKGRVLTRDMLLDRVWKVDYFGDTRTVDVHIRYLRQKIEDNAEKPTYILTARGVGYKFRDA